LGKRRIVGHSVPSAVIRLAVEMLDQLTE